MSTTVTLNKAYFAQHLPHVYKQACCHPAEHDTWKLLGNLLMLAEEFLTQEEYEAIAGKLQLEKEFVGMRAKVRFQYCVSQVVSHACGQEEGEEYA